MKADEVRIERLEKRHRRESFDCGEPSLNDFLRQYARQSAERGLSQTFVAVLPGNSDVIGYYTLSSGSISSDLFRERLPRYPVPIAHLGRLAVDSSAQGQHLGSVLLIDALKRSLVVSKELGIYAVELFALTNRAKQFYLKFGFIELKDDKHHLYVPIEVVRRLTA